MAAENKITYYEPDRIWTKDPDDVEKFTIDWTNWLQGDTIASTDWYQGESTSTDLTLTETNTTTSASAVISGGYHGGKYVMSNRIVTAAGLTKEKKLIIHVIDSECRRLCS